MTKTALTRPLSHREARALIAAATPAPTEQPTGRGSFKLPLASRIQLGVLASIVWIIGAVIVVSAIFGTVAIAATVWHDPIGALRWIIPLAVVGIALGILKQYEDRQRLIRRARTVLLARENGWDFELETLAIPPARSMKVGTERKVLDLVRLRRAPRIELGVFQTKVDAGRSTAIVRQDYLALALPQKLPNILLQAMPSGPRLGNAIAVPTGIDPDQFLSLEGDFDRYFRLYCPPGYERDALYLFTPDIMALFIDHAHGCSVEIIDNWLIVSGKEGRLRGTKIAQWTGTLDLIAAVEDKLEQWDEWRDDSKRRVAPRGTPRALARPKPGVAAAGARLRDLSRGDHIKRQLTIGAVILGSLAAVYAAVFIPILIADAR
ncbi:hypothetical protein [Microbacterium sp. ZW T5_56]|uniref:hypothetical protein n=1 Tax=Microbacterium sp. ZW T5_56 TaxID=3378081 RepID=UPI0038535464